MTTHAAPVTLDSRLTDFLHRDEAPAGRHASPWTVGDIWPVSNVWAQWHIGRANVKRRQYREDMLNNERVSLRALIFN